MWRGVYLYVSFCTKRHRLHPLSELLMEICWQTASSFLLKIFVISIHKKVIRSLVCPTIFMVGIIRIILEEICHLLTTRPQVPECHLGELLNNLLAWCKTDCTSELQILVNSENGGYSIISFPGSVPEDENQNCTRAGNLTVVDLF